MFLQNPYATVDVMYTKPRKHYAVQARIDFETKGNVDFIKKSLANKGLIINESQTVRLILAISLQKKEEILDKILEGLVLS